MIELNMLALLVIVTYTLTIALVSGIAIGLRIRSPVLAALAGAPTAVIALYASACVLGVILTDPDDYDSVDWWALAALLTYPATPAFVVGLVTACVTSSLRTICARLRS